LERLPGVRRADVRLEPGEAKVIYDAAKQTPEKLAAAVDRLGFQASVQGVVPAPRPTLYVDGLEDAKAVRRAEHALRRLKGVADVVVDPRAGEVFVEYDDGAVQARDLAAALDEAGFRARIAPP
jgi:copper chaperone CopZ